MLRRRPYCLALLELRLVPHVLIINQVHLLTQFCFLDRAMNVSRTDASGELLKTHLLVEFCVPVGELLPKLVHSTLLLPAISLAGLKVPLERFDESEAICPRNVLAPQLPFQVGHLLCLSGDLRLESLIMASQVITLIAASL